MIPFFPRYLIFISWLIVGPFGLAPPTIGLTALAITLLLFLRRSHSRRTVALLGIFGLMLIESVLVFCRIGISFYVTRRTEPPAGELKGYL